MKNIVILGAGVTGAPIIRQTMVNVVLKSKEYKLIAVSPNTHFHWPIAMPRVIVPGQLAEEKAMYELRSYYKEFPSDQFELVTGSAGALDPDANSVTVRLNDGTERAIPYHTLIVATGTSAKDNFPWKVVNNTAETKTLLQQTHKEIKDAKTIVVAGGGLTGSETVGELGFQYSKNHSKEVYFIYNDDLPLAPTIMDKVRKQVVTELQKLNVKLMPNTSVTKVTKQGADTILELQSADGKTKTLTAQAYVPALGMVPNTSFAPPNMLDANGYMKQTTTLQAEGRSNIFIVGDAGSLEPNQARFADSQSLWLIKNLPGYLQGGKLPQYELSTKVMVGVTLGQSRATGQMGSMKIFSFLIWWLKGRFLGTDYAGDVAAGKRTLTTVLEK